MAHRTRSTTARVPPPDPPPPPPPRAAAEQPVSQRTRSRYALAASLLTALPVLDVESGKLLEHKQLRRHPRLKKTWDTSYANELGRLCQGVGEGMAGPDKQQPAPSASSITMTSRKPSAPTSATRAWCVNIAPIRMTRIERASP